MTWLAPRGAYYWLPMSSLPTFSLILSCINFSYFIFSKAFLTLLKIFCFLDKVLRLFRDLSRLFWSVTIGYVSVKTLMLKVLLICGSGIVSSQIWRGQIFFIYSRAKSNELILAVLTVLGTILLLLMDSSWKSGLVRACCFDIKEWLLAHWISRWPYTFV